MLTAPSVPCVTALRPGGICGSWREPHDFPTMCKLSTTRIISKKAAFLICTVCSLIRHPTSVGVIALARAPLSMVNSRTYNRISSPMALHLNPQALVKVRCSNSTQVFLDNSSKTFKHLHSSHNIPATLLNNSSNSRSRSKLANLLLNRRSH